MATTAAEKESAPAEVFNEDTTAPTLPTHNVVEKQPEPAQGYHPAVYIFAWISLSSSIIIFNKWILHTAGFPYPLFLTTWHLVFATVMTQLMARHTNMLDSRHSVPMTGRIYLRAIVPIGVFFSLSLICGNLTYLYLSVSFIQMLKATNVVATLLASWAFQIEPPSLKKFGNVSMIVVGVIIASYGEIQFVFIGFLYQVGGIVFESIRLVMMQRLLSSAEFKMDPLVSLYYFAPVCALMNGLCTLVIEIPTMTMADIHKVGVAVLLANAVVAFALNISVVFLIGRTSALVLTLSGVLKDILLVLASMFIFGDPVTMTQTFGYAIALTGLVYYKLGADRLSSYVSQGRQSWAQYGSTHPAMRKVAVFAVAIALVFVLLGGLSGFVPDKSSGGGSAAVLDEVVTAGTGFDTDNA
ncbi:hypothetical protein MBLNU459_g7618t1 [Dothideomycetes sp. NU459]